MQHPTVEQTRHLIQLLHYGQTDKAGKPYHEHCERVADLLGEDATDEERIVALLHDVIEDTWICGTYLIQMGYPHKIVEAVFILTHHQLRLYSEKQSYNKYIKSIAKSGNRLAIKVKIADLKDNLDESRLALLPEETQASLRKRYERALKTLTESMERDNVRN